MVWKRVTFQVGIVLSILLLTSISNAQLNWRKFAYFDNKGGLNDNSSTTEIANNEATDLQNVTFDVGGAITKRKGFINIPAPKMYAVSTGAVATTKAITGICFYKKDSGSRYLLALGNADGEAIAWKKDYGATAGPATGEWDNITGTTLGSTYTNNYQPDFAIASDSVIFTTGQSQIPWVWTGTGICTQLTPAPATAATGSMVKFHKNQMFVGGDSDYPSRVYFSDLGDITYFYRTDFFDVATTDGSKVRGIVSAFDSLYIFKDRSIWRLSGDERDSFRLQKMVEGIGTLSNASIRVVNNYIYFTTAQNDIAVYDGAYTCKFISQKIRGTIGDLNFERATNNRGVAFSTYKYNDYDYYVSVSTAGSTTNNRILVFDTQYSAWTKFRGINACSMCVGDDDSFQDSLYFGDYSGYVMRYPSTNYMDGTVATDGTVASVAINAFYQSKWFKYSDIALGDKYWRLLKTYCLSSDDTILNAECRSDYESSGKVVQVNLTGSADKWDLGYWDVALWGGESIIVGRDEIEKGVTMFQVKFSNDQVNKGFTLLGYENFMEPTDRI